MPLGAFFTSLENIGTVYDVTYGGGDSDKKGTDSSNKPVSTAHIAQAKAMGLRVPRRM
ncbi:MAG: hypothetical protein ABIH23_05985 [bacterium]